MKKDSHSLFFFLTTALHWICLVAHEKITPDNEKINLHCNKIYQHTYGVIISSIFFAESSKPHLGAVHAAMAQSAGHRRRKTFGSIVPNLQFSIMLTVINPCHCQSLPPPLNAAAAICFLMQDRKARRGCSTCKKEAAPIHFVTAVLSPLSCRPARRGGRSLPPF
jgi:hypothetical protein